MKIRKIYLSWRKGTGSSRKIVGILKRTATDGITFKYIKEGVEEAQKEGFKEYPGFPLDFDRQYEEKNLDIFGLRLAPTDRKDSKNVLSFWLADHIQDKFDLLALTQGLLPTDNFEFLGLFNANKTLRFVTDVANLSHLDLPKDSVKVGDLVTYEIVNYPKAFENKAVKLFKSDLEIGFVKNIHNHVFVKSNRKLKLKVKAIEQNGTIKKIFLEVNR